MKNIFFSFIFIYEIIKELREKDNSFQEIEKQLKSPSFISAVVELISKSTNPEKPTKKLKRKIGFVPSMVPTLLSNIDLRRVFVFYWALVNQLVKKGYSEEEIYELFDNVDFKKIIPKKNL
ncbi:MAG: hypothetical protein WDK96_01785 [Candidatus Paceibacterota bacterium]|jgi:hypothetical protein